MNQPNPDANWTEQVQTMQDAYARWMALLPQLQAAQQQWQAAQAELQQLKDYYFGPQWQQHYEQLSAHTEENGGIDTHGHYHVLSQDALWDAFGAERALAWQWMRLAMGVLDNETADGA